MSANIAFRLAGFNVVEVKLTVYNRWGQKVYDSGTTNDLSLGWDGRYQDKDCELGVYVFMANVRYTDNTEEWLQGNVTLVR